MIGLEAVKKALTIMGFSPEDGTSGVWTKFYDKHSHKIAIKAGKSAAECTIDYGTPISDNAGRSTTTNLSQQESLVVLECVNRLLEEGYPPASLILEKTYPVGHTNGFLDVLVLRDGKPYLMIECKSWATEFDAAKEKFLNSYDSQLLTYYQQDSSAKFIALYTSRFTTAQVDFKTCAVDTTFLSGDSVKELFESWDKSYFERGAFGGIAYQIKEKRLTKADLVEMTAEDSGQIFNDFAEILRRHVVSDKPNAFNKMFNLFICKIQDEEKNSDEILAFQWQAGETAEAVLARLSDLYKDGMKSYLKMDISDHSAQEIDQLLTNIPPAARDSLRGIFTELRLYKNNEFAFKEVFDAKTFRANADVVREVVRLLQGKRLRYTHKQQFLGDFFERLLNTSVKQEAGQFFTPIPVARFVCESLPLRATIEKKIDSKQPKFLPYLIDYASGSGHFLTEAMDVIDRMVKSLDKQMLQTTQKSNLRKWSEDYAWADEFVYGIEKDYRLAKTAKVSCFLNGDGEANLICADGLDNFALSGEYSGRLKAASDKELHQDHPQFDVLVANPPYSVEQCRKTIKHGDKTFTLFDRLSDQSKEIECLFVERAKQLLVPDGVAGIILPASILSSSGIYEATREIIFKYFDLVSIVVMGSGTFMATGTNTVILFMRRRNNNDSVSIAGTIKEFFTHWLDCTVGGVEDGFSSYCQAVWGVPLADYVSFMRGNPSLLDHTLACEYKNEFESSSDIRQLRLRRSFMELSESEQQIQLKQRFQRFLEEREKQRLLYWFLSVSQKVVLARVPSEKNAEKAFLGYEFSNRRGQEGIRFLSGTDKIETSLYSLDQPEHPDKLSTLIRTNYLGESICIPEALKDVASLVDLHELITFDQVRFDKVIATTVIKKKDYSGRHQLVRISDLADLNPSNPPKGAIKDDEIVSFLDMPALRQGGGIQEVGSRIYGEIRGAGYSYFKLGDILFAKITPCMENGKVAIIEDLPFPHGFGSTEFHVLRPNGKLLPKLLYECLRMPSFLTEMERRMTGKSGHRRVPQEDLEGWGIPVPPPHEQERTVRHLVRYDRVVAEREKRILDGEKQLAQLVEGLYKQSKSRIKIGDLFDVNPKSVDPARIFGENEFTYVDIASVDATTATVDFSQRFKGVQAKDRARRVAQAGDVIISTVRPYLKAFAFLDRLPEGVIFSTGFAVLTSKQRDTSMNRLLFYLFRYSADLMDQMQVRMPKQAYPSITQADVAALTVPAEVASPEEAVGQLKAIDDRIRFNRTRLGAMRDHKASYMESWQAL
jgi:type I restriction enzyme M protein